MRGMHTKKPWAQLIRPMDRSHMPNLMIVQLRWTSEMSEILHFLSFCLFSLFIFLRCVQRSDPLTDFNAVRLQRREIMQEYVPFGGSEDLFFYI